MGTTYSVRMESVNQVHYNINELNRVPAVSRISSLTDHCFSRHVAMLTGATFLTLVPRRTQSLLVYFSFYSKTNIDILYHLRRHLSTAFFYVFHSFVPRNDVIEGVKATQSRGRPPVLHSGFGEDAPLSLWLIFWYFRSAAFHVSRSMFSL